MLNDIVSALIARTDLQAWAVRHITARGAQVYAVPKGIEARRGVESERFVVDVLRQTPGADGSPTCGSGNATLLPGDDIGRALDKATLMAGLVHNPVYTIPAPAPLPEVPLADADLQKDAAHVLEEAMSRLRASLAPHPRVRLTAAECFGEEHATHLINSRGIDAAQVATSVEMEFVLHGKQGAREVESFVELSRRRVANLDIEAEVQRQAQYTMDLLTAAPPPKWQGPVVLRGAALATVLGGDKILGGVLQTLGAASAKYAKLSPWEIGQSVFRREVTGDPLTVWATRCLPYGTNSNRFDDEGLPAQRVELIRDNTLAAFTASQRYADYLSLRPTGAFGGVELPPGKMPASTLLAEPHVEIIQFSWFNPDEITGDFATEIRLGYLVENGKRTPFKGGQLVGNYLDALADVHWSAETDFFGIYLGPTTARFNALTVAGEEG